MSACHSANMHNTQLPFALSHDSGPVSKGLLVRLIYSYPGIFKICQLTEEILI